MDRLLNLVEEVVESVNPREQGLPASEPSESIRSESQTPAKPNEALLRIAQDMPRMCYCNSNIESVDLPNILN